VIKHHTLKPCIGAHVHAYLLTHPAGVGVGRDGKKADPEHFPAAELYLEEAINQISNRSEIADKGDAGKQRQQQP